MDKIQMVDLSRQYHGIKNEVEDGLKDVISSCAFINGPAVKSFQASLEAYLDVSAVIPCANGTDALQIALMALGLKPGDEVIVPAFTYVATVEVIALLNLKPKFVEVDPKTFNIDVSKLEASITSKTKAIVPVHLYGQTSDMEALMEFASSHSLFVVEDNAQAIGSDFTYSDGRIQKSGTIAHIGCTSFYPSKNLGAYGDGGALMSNDENLASTIRMMANHGQSRRYYHDSIGVNSRLDSMQAVVLNAKLKKLDEYNKKRQDLAGFYDENLKGIDALEIPFRATNSTHVFHQYTLKVERRNELKEYLAGHGIPTMIYYPVPVHKQKAYSHYHEGTDLSISEKLCDQVISLPIHPNMDDDQKEHIVNHVKSFYKS